MKFETIPLQAFMKEKNDCVCIQSAVRFTVVITV